MADILQYAPPIGKKASRWLTFFANLSLAYPLVVLGLLYGEGDFSKTLEVSARAGQDSDCNPSNAAGVLGVMLGYRRIPGQWKSGIPAIADQKFKYTDFTFHTIVESILIILRQLLVLNTVLPVFVI